MNDVNKNLQKNLTMPPLMIGCGLLFWGWQTNIWLFSIPFAILYEISHLIRWRWNFSDIDIRRAASVATVSLIGMYTYIAVTGGWLNAITIFFRGLPLVVYPILLLQAYSVDGKINFRSLLLFAKFDAEIAKQKRNFSILYPYFILTILCASAAANPSITFYLGLLAITVYPLWQRRSPRTHLITWLLMLTLAASLGFVGQIGLRQMHLYAEQQAINWLSKFYQGEQDPYKASTSIGEIGAIKQSNHITFRVRSPEQKAVPRLFREAVFNKYQGGMWIATDSEFEAVNSNSDTDTWTWQTVDIPAETVEVIENTTKGKALLKLPQGSFQVEQLPAQSLERNQYGTVRLEDKHHLIEYQVDFVDEQNFDSQPNNQDLFVPPDETQNLDKVITDNQLKGISTSKTIQQLEAFFLANFRYSLKLAGEGQQKTPLASFLLDQRQGHCEYFATATTLLLREMGIPARYAVGYSVHEFNPLQQQYLVRDRHAHAWTLVYLDGRWQDFDTTPPSWTEIEDQAAAGFTFFGDFISWAWLQIKFSLRDILTPENIRRWWWIILPILLARMWFIKSDQQENLGRKLLRRDRRRQNKAQEIESAFMIIEKTLNQAGFVRGESQTILAWLEDLNDDSMTAAMLQDLEEIVRLYYRDRFDPQGLSPTELATLQHLIQGWLTRWHNQNNCSR